MYHIHAVLNHDIYNVDWEQIAFMLVNGASPTYPDSVSFCCIVKKTELRKNKENYLDE